MDVKRWKVVIDSGNCPYTSAFDMCLLCGTSDNTLMDCTHENCPVKHIPRPDPADIDDTFWKDNQDKPEECYDPMAQAMRFIDNLGLLESLVVSTLDGRKKIYNILKTERKQIVIETMNRFSDICSMIDAVREEGEGTYEACKRLIDTNSKCPDPAEVERLVDELIKASGYYSQIGSSSLSKKREKARTDLLKLVGGE